MPRSLVVSVAFGALVALPGLARAQAAAPSEEERRVLALRYAPELQVDLARSERLRGGLYIRDLRVGTGDPVTAGDDVVLRVTTWRHDGTRVAGGGCRTLGVRVGRGSLLPAVDLALLLMQEGGIRQVVVPPSLGYRHVDDLNAQTGQVLVLQVELLRRGQLDDEEHGWSGPTHCVMARAQRDVVARRHAP